MNNVLTIEGLASNLGLEPSYIRDRGARDSDEGVVLPYAADRSGHVIVAASGKRHREGSFAPEAFGWDEARSREGGDLLVVASEFGQLALGQHGFRSVAIAEDSDLDALGLMVYASSSRVIFVAEPKHEWLIDAAHRFIRVEDRTGATWIATLPDNASSVAALHRSSPPTFVKAIDGAVAQAIPLGDYVSSLPGTLLSDVEVEPIEWLWKDRIPLAKHVDVAADPGVGKTVVFEADLVARITTGREMPDGTPGVKGGVVICNSEDGPGDTLLPRIIAAGGDPDQVVVLSQIQDPETKRMRPLVLPGDARYVEAAAKRVSAVLIVIDPFPSFLAKELSANVDQDVRIALGRLGAVAKRTGAAVVTIRHLNKGVKMSAMYRSSGSIGITGIARAAHLMAKVPGSDLRALVCLKSNLGPEPKPLGYRITSNENGIPVVEWTGILDVDPEDLLNPPRFSREAEKLDSAKEFIEQQLADGPRPTVELEQRAKEAGISIRTLSRARGELKVESKPSGFQKPFICALPETDTQT